jgi:plastocyanin domain-containing protein
MKNRITTLQKVTFFGTLAGFEFLLGAISGVMAAEMETQQAVTQFQPIAQPLENRIGVTLGGLGLIGAELWWFVLSKPKSRKASTQEGVQEVTIMVDGGYEPSQIAVQAGQPVRLNFYRKDPSSCLEEVRLPDFRIAQQLELNQTTPVEFTPDKPGKYEFACGMNMFRGVIEVQAKKLQTK